MNDRLCNALPTILMVVAQFCFAGVNICYKLAASHGMSLTILIAYRLLFASAFIVPIAFFHERFHFLPLLFLFLFISLFSYSNFHAFTLPTHLLPIETDNSNLYWLQRQKAQAHLVGSLLRLSLWTLWVRPFMSFLFSLSLFH